MTMNLQPLDSFGVDGSLGSLSPLKEALPDGQNVMQIPKIYFAASGGKYRWFVKEPGEIQESPLFDSKEACIADANRNIPKHDAVYLWDIPNNGKPR